MAQSGGLAQHSRAWPAAGELGGLDVEEAALLAADPHALEPQQGFMLHMLDAGSGLQLAPGMLAPHNLASAQSRQAAAAGQQPHTPDPDASHEQERKERRKVANREAARRMRQRRADQLSDLGSANEELKGENAALQQQLAQLASHNRELVAEVAGLRQQVLSLKQALESSGGAAGDAQAPDPA